MIKIVVFLFAFTILGFTGIEASAYLFDDYILMEKNNNQLIYVNEKSVDKLTDRGFAKKTADFAKECNTRFIEDTREDSTLKIGSDYHITSDCTISKNNNTLCVFIINSTDTCIHEFAKPTNLKDCRMIYKMNSVYYMQGNFPHPDYPDNINNLFPYFHIFSNYFCDMIPDYVNSGNYFDEWDIIFSDTKILYVSTFTHKSISLHKKI